MDSIVDLIKRHVGITLTDETGAPLQISLSKGATEAELTAFEEKNAKIPAELRQLLAFSNGIDLYGITIMPLDEILFYEDTGMLGFHNWGNGDFDCISVEYGGVIFMQHAEENITPMAQSLGDWLTEVIEEITAFHTLLHPMDYEEGRKEEGMYSGVSLLSDDDDVTDSKESPQPEERNTLTAVAQLFKGLLVAEIDQAIVEQLGWDIYEGTIDRLISIVKDEIDCSVFSVDQIALFMQENKQLIIDFSIAFQENREKKATLSKGVCITFTLFLMYLLQQEKLLLDYIKCRRIPGPKGMLKKLVGIRKELGF